ncbi:MAG: hybrid sensor histidine kinase/response regulator [Spirochaetota bacterium]
MAFDREKFIQRFVEESRKHIKQLSSGLLELEQDPSENQVLQTVFRSAHTIKGSANMIGFTELSEFAHRIENQLSLLREGKAPFSKDRADLLLACTDELSRLVEHIASSGKADSVDQELLQRVEKLETGESSSSPADADIDQKKQEAQQSAAQQSIAERRTRPRMPQDHFVIKAEKLQDLTQLVSELSLWTRTLREDFQADGRKAAFTRETKQHTGKLDQLNDELKDMLFSLRMVPLSTALEKYPRVVRETASQSDKQVSLSITGDDTELDKASLELMDEAMLQIVRNAVDHGIEPPQQRKENGKPERGTVTISAGYEHGMCRITIADDGTGIDVPKLCQLAIEKNLISSSEAERIQKQQDSAALAQLLFTPGLSSKQIITGLSGRGVGMDIVKENILNKLGGTFSVETATGEGTTVSVVLPLNAAIMNVSVLRIGTLSVALPTHSITEILRYEEADCITVVDQRTLRHGEELLPIASIEDLFSLRPRNNEQNHALLIVVRTGHGHVAVGIDEILLQESFVIHSLPPHLRSTPWVSGCIILGPYEIAPVVNTQHLLQLIHRSTPPSNNSSLETKANTQKEKTTRILVVDDSVSTRDIEQSILESYGYHVQTAEDGQQALERALDEVFDLIITDIEMPAMDGISLTQRLRTERSYRHTPIILVTSRDSEQDRKRGIQAGADAYIVKTAFDQKDLIQTIQTLVG